MNSIERETLAFRWDQLVKLNPLPWRLERMNDHGVTVANCRGGIVLELEYSEQGPDFSSATYENGVMSDRAIALLLVTMSEVESGNPFARKALSDARNLSAGMEGGRK